MKEIKKQRKEENAMEGNKITLIFFTMFLQRIRAYQKPYIEGILHKKVSLPCFKKQLILNDNQPIKHVSKCMEPLLENRANT